MEQPKVESVEEIVNNESKDSVDNVNLENPVEPDIEELKSSSTTQEIENISENILVDSMKIEPVVTEITTEIVSIVVDNDETTPESLSKDCETNSQPNLEIEEQLLQVVGIEQSDSTNINTEVIEQNENLGDRRNEETVLPDLVNSDEPCDPEDTKPPVEIVDRTDEREENEENYVEENVIADESCDPSAMGVVEEIVMTSKSAYSVEIQEQDSTDSRENFITKDLVVLEVVSENEDTINVVEDHIQEIEIEEANEGDDGSSGVKLRTKVLMSEDGNDEDVEDEDNSQSSMEMELKDESSEVVNEDVKDVAILDNAMEDDTNEDKTAIHGVEDKSLVKSNDNHRSVIQEIVDDWIDDNIDDICDSKNNESDAHDSVEIELKTLLADDKPFSKDIRLTKDVNKFGNKILNQERVSGNLRNLRNNTEFTTKERVNGLENKPETGKSTAATGEILSRKEIHSVQLQLGQSGTSPTQDTTASKQKQSTKLGQKISTRHLMSQIASTAEVTQVLKERIKQKQQEVDLPQGGDILFVKKITQRLSSKLSGGSTHSLTEKKNLSKSSNVSSENYSNNSAVEKTMDDAEKIETADNRELLAILEGDVDPDWSNLKPHTENEAPKSSEAPVESSISAKLDPLTERELALKQLLELPTITVKKNTVKKRRTFKPAPSRVSTNIDLITEDSDVKQQTVSIVESEPVQVLSPDDDDSPPKIDIVIQEEEMDFSAEDSHVEESRSGRKRKPTEKAREHEQNSVKKQKVYKGKVVDQKKTPKIESPMDELPQEYQEPPELDEYPIESEPLPVENKPVGRNILSKIATTKNRIYQSKSSKIGNKLPQNINIVKRNIPVKKLLRQKGSSNVTNPKTVHMKSKFTPPQKKYRSTIKQKVQKRLIDVPLGEIKPKKKSNEIDKLLQDEGVVNLLYDVEQPGRKRLVPITKSQTKVMDLHKVQRELKIRTKLVRNAVLRLRTSGASPTKISPRSKRGVSLISTPDTEGRENERNKSTRSSISSNPDFIIPAKIRNAADASVIVRRHSSSSFSSTSGSPRASIDGPDKQMEASGSEERPVHVTRSSRRRYSQNEKNKQFAEVLSTPKKNGVNRKKSAEPAEIENIIVSKEKSSVVASRPSLRTDGKSVEKTAKNSENIDVGKSSNNESSGSKISTRSNGASVEREIIKTKKGTKTKAVGNRTAKDLALDTVTDIKEEDKLSACLAEAASALSNVDSNANQSGSTIVNRKLRAMSIIPKTIEKSPSEILDQFSNEEIQLRRHGNIVQIILTPLSTKLKNGFTLQIMNELSEVLLLLRKDEGCRVVLLTSTGTSFCEGLDLSNLIHENREERRVHAEEMANGVKEFIKALAHFNKPIVAGIQGAAVGLGVTMLPLFDLVIASDKATFSTPYGQLGQIPEGAAILTLSQTVGNTVTSELLLGGRILTASEALRAGLVTRVLWPDRFQGDLIPSLRSMSENSSQSMEATKTLLRHSLRKKLDAALDSESYLLIQQWCSAECQTLIKSYLDGEGGGH